MASAEGVVFTLGAFQKSRKPTCLADSGHLLAPTGEDFMGVGLVADIPHQPIIRSIEDVVQRNRQFHRSKARREMPTGG